MKAREEILQRLRNKTREESLPPAWISRRQFDNLAERFSAALTAAKGEVHQAGDLESALTITGEILGEIGAQTGIADAVPPLEGIDLGMRWPEVEWRRASLDDGDFPSFAASADIGLSVAQGALAETGSVIVSSGPRRSRLTGLLPPVHLVLVPVSRLTTDIFTWTAERRDPPPASLLLISGPSKTADIEQTMATGVHGPKRFIAVLYED